MAKAKEMLKGEMLPPKDQELVAMAKQIDAEIRREVKSVDRSMMKLAEMLATMRDRHLWQYLHGFRRFEDYAQHVLGNLARSRSKVFNLLAIHALTKGQNPVPVELVERMGHKKAVELARLEPSQRTPELVRAAVEQPLTVVRRAVLEKINMGLPPDEQREATVLFSINLPESTRDRLEELLEVGIWMEGIRDGDRTQSMRQKFFGVMIFATENYFPQELAEAAEYLKARQAMEHGTPSGIEEDECPPEPEELDAQEDQQDIAVRF